jgi:hypothetical protein
MNRLATRFFLLAVVAGGLRAADEPVTKADISDAIKTRIAEEAKQGRTKPVGPARTQAAEEIAHPAPAPAATAAPAKATVSTAEAEKAREQAPTVLDPVEVQKRKLSEFERDVHKQEADIIREKKNTQPTEMDKALNNPAVSKALALFGGQSSQQRANLASERVSMMEDEKDIIEAIRNAKTKEEKAELKKQLEDLKTMRRELEKSLK